MTGLITRATAGFYYVQCSGRVIECHARGILRREGNSPLVGDLVEITENGEAGTVESILPRRNRLVRPPVANIDRLLIVSSTITPAPDLLSIDKLAAIAEQQGIEPVIIFTKTDKIPADKLVDIYRRAGFKAYGVSNLTGEGIGPVTELVKSGVSVLTGNSGVGKSSLINRIAPEMFLKIGDISRKLQRGRHTTRVVEFFPFYGGYVADTPGFSSIDIVQAQVIRKEDLPYMFREFAPYLDHCRFTGCSHTKELGCAVLEAVKAGKIALSRHSSYCAMYDEIKDLKDWELKDTPKG